MTPPDSSPDYVVVEIPPDKPTEEYHYTERRADLLARLREEGSPVNLPSQSQLATQYGVSQSVISRDLDRLAEHIENSLGDRHVMSTQVAFDRALAGALAEEQWEAASRIADRRASWVRERTILRRLDGKLDELMDHRDPEGALAGTTNTDTGTDVDPGRERETPLPEVLPTDDGRIVVCDLDGVAENEYPPTSSEDSASDTTDEPEVD